MNPIGITTWIWTSPLTTERFGEVVPHIKQLGFDLVEVPIEGTNDLDYATVAMRFSMIDATRRITEGSIVAGSDKARTEATEVWTFLRSRGGKWILSAIQQT